MGNWNINIQGIGCHHNGKPEIDADLAAAEFVQVLKKQGHKIESASFTSGGKTELLPIDPEEHTAKLYEAYCYAVGGKAFNGDPLPDWKTFAADPSKQKQVQAWRIVGCVARGQA